MSSHLGLIEAVMLEVVVMTIGIRELYLLRKDEKKAAPDQPNDPAAEANRDEHDHSKK